MFIYRLIAALDHHKVPYALVGGYAVALHGAVRGTVDVDLAIRLTKRDFQAAEKAFRSIGLESRLPVTGEQVFNFRKDYIENRNLVAWSFYNPAKPLEVVDVLITEDLKKMKTEALKAGKLTIRVASIEDLIRMKIKAGRPQDKADIAALRKLKP